MACWAECLGGCSKNQSREHLVSEALFPERIIRVQGFDWCREVPKDIGISGLTAKILCERHNNDLSPVDEAGGKAFATFREIRRLSTVRDAIKPRPWNIVKYKLNGRMLERWLLKTLINISCDKDFPIGRTSATPGRPTHELVRIAYGLDRFKGRAGFSFVVRTGMRMQLNETFKFSPLVKDRHHIEGGLFVFRGFSLLLFLEEEGAPAPLTGIRLEGEDLGDCQLNFHNETMKVKVGKYVSHVLTMEWS